MSKIKLLNTEIDNLTMSEAAKTVCVLAQTSEPEYVVTPNVDHIVQLEHDSEFRSAYSHASLSLLDGQALFWLSRLMGNPVKEKISGSDLLPAVCAKAATMQLRIFILGGMPGVAKIAAEKLEMKFKGLNIVGTYSPNRGFEKDEEQINQIIEIIHKANPDILFACFGSPKTEKFLLHNYKRMDVPVSLSVGAAVDFQAGTVKRAPRWVSRIGLEWLYRTLREPKRLAGRYFNDITNILPIVLKYW